MNMDDLRQSLFETLQAVKSGDMETDRAKAVCNIASEITKAAKVQIEFMTKFDARDDAGFFGNKPSNAISQQARIAIENKKGNPLL